MAKGTGLIGNFKGKVGNTVGYKLSASNNGQTQGIRVYQPIVKNPKTAAQAEQRAKLLAVNATYRALKMVIDRGNEGLPYGNKSRLAWLKGALKSTQMPWYEKGALVTFPVGGLISKGSLPSLSTTFDGTSITIYCEGLAAQTDLSTVGKFSTAIKAANSFLKEGDQITFAMTIRGYNDIHPIVFSIVLDSTSTVALSGFEAQENSIAYETLDAVSGFAVIVSRQGDNGEHLRSTEMYDVPEQQLAEAPYNNASKAAAIASYQASAATNSDWAEESIQ